MFEITFKPICKIEENLRFLPDNSANAGYYKVKLIEAIQPMIYDFGSLGALEWSDAKGSGDLGIELDDSWLGIFLVIPLDDNMIEVKMKAAKARYGIKGKVTYISHIYSPTNLCEIAQWEDVENVFLVQNPTNSTQAKNRLLFLGFKYYCEKYPVGQIPEKWTGVIVEAVE